MCLYILPTIWGKNRVLPMSASSVCDICQYQNSNSITELKKRLKCLYEHIRVIIHVDLCTTYKFLILMLNFLRFADTISVAQLIASDFKLQMYKGVYARIVDPQVWISVMQVII